MGGRRKRIRRKESSSSGVQKRERTTVSAEDLPRRPLEDAVRVADVLHRNYAGKGASWDEIARALGVSASNPRNKYPLWSAVAYGVLTKDDKGLFSLAETGRKILSPNYDGEDREGKAKAVLTPRTLSKFLTDYNGHLIPDTAHLPNVLENRYSVPRDRVPEAIELIQENARYAGVVEDRQEGLAIRLEGVVVPEKPSDAALRDEGGDTTARPQTPAADKQDWSRVCFFITPIGEEGSETRRHADMILRHVVEPVTGDFGLSVVRADKIERSGLITQQVFEHLVRSRLCFADLSFTNANVFYELGVRHTCKLPTIQLIRKSDKIPFDVAQGRTIKVDTSDIYLMADRLDSARNELREHVKHIMECSPTEPGEDNPVHVYLPRLKVQL